MRIFCIKDPGDFCHPLGKHSDEWGGSLHTGGCPWWKKALPEGSCGFCLAAGRTALAASRYGIDNDLQPGQQVKIGWDAKDAVKGNR